MRSTSIGPWSPSRSAFAGFRFPADVIVVAIRWYLRYKPLLPRRRRAARRARIEVDHVTVYRWVQRFTPLLADAARFTRHAPGDRWYVDEASWSASRRHSRHWARVVCRGNRELHSVSEITAFELLPKLWMIGASEIQRPRERVAGG
jgi:transposase-like protein